MLSGRPLRVIYYRHLIIEQSLMSYVLSQWLTKSQTFENQMTKVTLKNPEGKV